MIQDSLVKRAVPTGLELVNHGRQIVVYRLSCLRFWHVVFYARARIIITTTTYLFWFG